MEMVISTSYLMVSPTTDFQEVYAEFSQMLNLPHGVLKIGSITIDRIELDSNTKL
jgi:hypothetical protein